MGPRTPIVPPGVEPTRRHASALSPLSIPTIPSPSESDLAANASEPMSRHEGQVRPRRAEFLPPDAGRGAEGGDAASRVEELEARNAALEARIKALEKGKPPEKADRGRGITIETNK